MRPGLEVVIKLSCYAKQSDSTGLFVSWCPALDIKSQGRTVEQARASLNDSVRLFILHCMKRGILEEALAQRGFVPCDDEKATDGDGADDEDIDMVSVRESHVDSWEGDYAVPFHLVDKFKKKRFLGDRARMTS